MKSALVFGLILALVVAPLEALAQRGGGRGFGGGGFGGGRGGGFSGGGGGGGGGFGGGRSGGSSGGGGARAGGGSSASGNSGMAGGRSVASGGGRPGGPGGHPGGPGARPGGASNFAHRPPYHNGGWYHGDWGGHWGYAGAYRPWGWYGYGGGWGWGGWGWGGFGLGFAGGLATAGLMGMYGSPWGCGYYNYYNPYWVAPVGGSVTYINYGQPIVASPPVNVVQNGAPAGAPGYGGGGYGYAPQAGAPGGVNQPSFVQQNFGSQYAGQGSPPVPGPPAPSDASGYAGAGAGAPGLGAPGSAVSTTQQKALDIFESARELFKRGDYQTALSQTNRAVAMLPNDSLLHEFRALCLFALKEYQQAAAAMYAVLSAGPGWDWATLSGLYPNVDVYEQQLRALESYRNENFDVGAAHFLLAYHYMLAGHNEPAAAELREVVRLQPGDQLATQLLKGLTTPATPSTNPGDLAGGPEPSAEGPALPPSAPVEIASILGHWKASRPDGSKFALTLNADGKFNWNFATQDKKQDLAGTYTLADNYLILKASDQNALVGQVALDPGGKLIFKLAGGSPNDPGLAFSR